MYDKKGRIQLFLKPENKAKLNLLAASSNRPASKVIDQLIEEAELDLSKFQKFTKVKSV